MHRSRFVELSQLLLAHRGVRCSEVFEAHRSIAKKVGQVRQSWASSLFYSVFAVLNLANFADQITSGLFAGSGAVKSLRPTKASKRKLAKLANFVVL